MRRRGARIFLRRCILVEDANGQARAAQQERREESDGPAASNENSPPACVHSLQPFTKFILKKPRFRHARFLALRRGWE
jgi:hypothetical protein